jgi:hypothetical protein
MTPPSEPELKARSERIRDVEFEEGTEFTDASEPEARSERGSPLISMEHVWVGRDMNVIYGKSEAPPVYNVTFNISGGTFGQLNTAVETVHNLANRLTVIGAEGRPDLAEALRELGQAVLDEPSLDDQARAELIDNVDDLSEQAKAPADERKRGRLRAAIDAISAAATAGTQLHAAWDAWGPTIQQLLPH